MIVQDALRDEDFRRIAEKGIERNRWIETVYLYAFDDAGKIKASMTIRIDWERHSFHITGNRNYVDIDRGSGAAAHLSVAIEEMVRFFKGKVTEHGWITQWVVAYTPGVDRDLVDRELGLEDSPRREWASGETVHVIGNVPGPLDELSVDLTVVVPADPAARIEKDAGTVKFFNDEKGWGFIRPERGGPDVFVHYTSIVASGFRNLSEGQRVEYNLAAGPRGPRAVDVTVVEPPSRW